MIHWITEKLYQRQMRNMRKGISGSLEKELKSLHPGEEVKQKWKEHCKEKVKIAILFGTIGLLIMFLYVLFFTPERVLTEGGTIKRNMYGQGQKQVSLEATIREQTYPITVTVEEKQMSDKEVRSILEEVANMLPDYIKKENADLNEVTTPLYLPTEIAGYPVTIEWQTSDTSYINIDGSLGKLARSSDGEDILLYATISYKELKKELVIPICVYALSGNESEGIPEGLTEQIRMSQEETKDAQYFKLPSEYEGQPIIWKEKRSLGIGLIVILWMFISWLMVKRKDEILKEKWEERNRQLLLEYGEFVGKIRLMMGAGLSLSNSLKKMVSDYKNSCRKNGKKKYVYEELVFAVHKMESGARERDALLEFGVRCELACYKKLISILLQNQKKGNLGLLTALESEVKNAFDERKAVAKKLGEEAGTKLLVPMMMMMAMVMIMIIIPAYISFGNL